MKKEKPKLNIRKIDFQKRVQMVLKEEEKLYRKHNVAKNILVHFPRRRKVPFSARVATWILRVKGGIIDIKYLDLTKK